MWVVAASVQDLVGRVTVVSHVSDPHFLVLHSLRLKGFATEAAVAELSGLAPSEVDARLSTLGSGGLAMHREGRITGWALTPAGRELHNSSVSDDLAMAGCRSEVDDAYRRFLAVNLAFLTVCTDWQMRAGPTGEQALNDHSDGAYDASIIDRLREIDARVQPVCTDLALVMDRFAAYGPRFATALAKIDGGAYEWFTGALIESYHTVWFELHEDLLVTLGIKREKEGAH